ncbi:Putative aliphatic sulfonates-binding protein precursor [Candidatus Xiphinematobacter sp. Idaho Grape]|nr:Putative aliphatic sulfonates-binding protein precursor [Candidatus Xiphinematobacter sp. Idaho Grape]
MRGYNTTSVMQSSHRLAILFCIVFPLCGVYTSPGREVIRVGLLPNVAHAQALVASNMSRDGEGWFEKRLGSGVDVQWFVFHAGPSAVEAIFAGSIDLTYIGPCPALNGYLRSSGEDIRVLSGAANGGEALVVRSPEWKSARDLRGKTICTPQLGNTQDVTCRAWLIRNGMQVSLTGGDVHVVPLENPDIFTQFSRGSIDGAWTVEPWVSRLLTEAGGHVLYRPRDTVATVLVTSVRFLEEKPAIARRFLTAHQELTTWVTENPRKAQEKIRRELFECVGQDFSAELICEVWRGMHFNNAIRLRDFEQFMADARLSKLSRVCFDLSKLIITLPAYPRHEPK